MKQVFVHKAASVGSQQVEDVVIILDNPFPEHNSTQAVINELDFDAKLLCDTLRKTLPQGTFERLTAKMLEATASSLIVNRLG